MGHLHIGVEEDDHDLESAMDIMKACDLTLGVPSILLDKDTRRKELYGKAGAFRFKPYLAEYRVLSNFWIWKDEYIDFAFNNTKLAFDFYNSNDFSSIVIKNEDRIVNCINNNDKKMAEKLVKEFNLL